eukprot:982814-Pelagomonas_calceolata.AAC.6
MLAPIVSFSTVRTAQVQPDRHCLHAAHVPGVCMQHVHRQRAGRGGWGRGPAVLLRRLLHVGGQPDMPGL